MPETCWTSRSPPPALRCALACSPCGRENRARGRAAEGEHQAATGRQVASPLPRRSRSGALQTLRLQGRGRDLTGRADGRSSHQGSRPAATEQDYRASVLRRLVATPGLGIRHPHSHGSRNALVRPRRLPARTGATSHIEAWIKRMADQPLAAGTIKTRYNNVRGVFRAAVRDRLIVRDPTEAVRLPRQRRADASMTIPIVQEVGVLLGAADDSFRAFVAPCASVGLRLGEAAAVQVADYRLPATPTQRVPSGAAGRRAEDRDQGTQVRLGARPPPARRACDAARSARRSPHLRTSGRPLAVPE